MNLRHTSTTLTAYTASRPAVLHAVDEATEDGVRAQSLESDRTSGHTTVLDEHGLPMPAVSDPTGETGVAFATGGDYGRKLRVDLDLAELTVISATGTIYRTQPQSVTVASRTLWLWTQDPNRPTVDPLQAQRLKSAAETLASIAARFVCRCGRLHRCPLHSTVSDKDLAQALAKLSTGNSVVCAFCGNEPPRTKNPTTVKANLPEARWVGSACYGFINDNGRPPSRAELQYHHEHGRWRPRKVA